MTTLTPVKDARIESVNASSNFGAAEILIAGIVTSKGTSIIRSLFEFDLSALPGFDTATLRLYVTIASSNHGNVVARKLTQTFVENQVTWNSYSTGNNWATPGGDFDDKFDSAVIDVSSTGWAEIDITGLALNAVSSHAGLLRFGLIETEATGGQHAWFASKEHMTESGPELVIATSVPSKRIRRTVRSVNT